MNDLINKVRVFALAAALLAGMLSFVPTDAVAREAEEGGFICITDPQVCFTEHDPDGTETGHTHGIPSGHN